VTGAAGRRPRARLDRRAAVVLVVVFGLALAVSRGCQQSQVRVSQEQAIAAAEREVGFTPRRTQIRLVRQGLSGRPYWAVSLSVPGRGDSFERLAVVRVDANTGAVAEVGEQR
jgi:uncharacterized membrane protein YkoI